MYLIIASILVHAILSELLTGRASGYTMNNFLYSNRWSVHIKLLLGICPFIVDANNTRVLSTTATASYQILYIVMLVCVYPVPAYHAYLLFSQETQSTSRKTTIAIEHLTIMSAVLSMLIVSLRNRKCHTALINALSALYNQVQSETPRTELRNFQRLHIRNVLYVLAFFSVPASNILVFNGNVHFTPLIVAFYLLYIFVMTNALILIVHIQDIAIVLTDLFRMCLRSERMDISWANVAALNSACDLTVAFGECFGKQLLLNAIKDVVVMINMIFYNIREMIFVQFDMSVDEMYNMVTFVGPIVVKNFILAYVIDRLEQQVDMV